MTSKTFTPGTVIDSAWLNDVNTSTYKDRISVATYGAKGDGVSDDTAAIQAALNAAYGATTSKAVYFPPGLYIVSGTLVINSRTAMIADSGGSVRIRQTNSSATLIKSTNFDALTGTSNSGGVRRVGFKDIVFEGVVSGGTPSGNNTQHGIQIYGYGCTFEGIHIRGFGGYGLNTEWATPGTGPDSGYDDGFTENRLMGIKVYENGLSGIKCDGANDGQWLGVISYSNNMKDTSTDKANVWITNKGNPQHIDQLHAWGNSSGVALLLEGSAHCSNCALEGASNVQLKIKTGEVTFKGGMVFAAGASSSIGIQFVGGPSVCIGYDIDTVIENDNGGSIDFGTGIDSYKLNIRAFQTTGTVMLGTLPTSGVGKSFKIQFGGGANNRATTQREYSLVATNLSTTGTGDTGFEYADHGGEGILSLPQRKTEPAATTYPASGIFVYGRADALRVHQSSGHVGAIMGEPPSPVTPVDNYNVSFYQTHSFQAAASPVTINNFVGGLNGIPFYVLMPSGGSEITISVAGNIRTKTGAAITRTGLGSNRMIAFNLAKDGNYYQI